MNHGMSRVRTSILFVMIACLSLVLLRCSQTGPRFSIRFDASQSKDALDGRLLLMVSANPGDEPRFQIEDGPETQLIFGIDVDGWKPGEERIIDGGVPGFPLRKITDIPAGTYHVQALIHRYETFHRSDGHVVKLPMDRGEGQQWNRAPGNLYSTPQQVQFDPGKTGTI